jgi:hypothetical protein
MQLSWKGKWPRWGNWRLGPKIVAFFVEEGLRFCGSDQNVRKEKHRNLKGVEIMGWNVLVKFNCNWNYRPTILNNLDNNFVKMYFFFLHNSNSNRENVFTKKVIAKMLTFQNNNSDMTNLSEKIVTWLIIKKLWHE